MIEHDMEIILICIFFVVVMEEMILSYVYSGDDYEQPMPTDLTREAVAQSWFR